MKTCAGCGLPAPSSTLACALCARAFPTSSPISYRLAPAGAGYRWTLDGEEVAVASLRDGVWDVVDTASGRVALSLVAGPPVEPGLPVRVALVDHRSRPVATYSSGPPDNGCAGVVADRLDRVSMVLRLDGPTGLHVVDADGVVLALASELLGPGRAGLDILLTRAGATRSETIVFGALLAHELLRVGDLRSVA